jgi:hypothetical protein
VAQEIFATFAVSIKLMTKGFLAVAMEKAVRVETLPGERSWLLRAVERCGEEHIPWDNQQLFNQFTDVVENLEGRVEVRLTLARVLGRFLCKGDRKDREITPTGYICQGLKGFKSELEWDEKKCMEFLVLLEVLRGWCREPVKDKEDERRLRVEGMLVHHLKFILVNILYIDFSGVGGSGGGGVNPAITVKARIIEGCLEVLAACGVKGESAGGGAGVRGEGGGVVVCSDEEITLYVTIGMICDLHFGDTRNELTPANFKRLPNNHSEEQTTTPSPVFPHTSTPTCFLPFPTQGGARTRTHTLTTWLGN